MGDALGRRPCVTVAPVLAGRRFHVVVDLDATGSRPVGLQIKNGERLCEGSYETATLDLVALLATQALQAGAPLSEVVDGLRGTEGGPDGAVEDVDGVVSALSVPDLVGQILEAYR